jgi:hypothetical protein
MSQTKVPRRPALAASFSWSATRDQTSRASASSIRLSRNARSLRDRASSACNRRDCSCLISGGSEVGFVETSSGAPARPILASGRAMLSAMEPARTSIRPIKPIVAKERVLTVEEIAD